MPITTYDVALKAQWDALLAAFSSEAVVGKRLDGISYVGRTFDLWTEKAPAIGVQLMSASVGPSASMQRELTTVYAVVVGCQSTDATASANMGANTPANIEDAMNQVQSFVADGAGNGIIPILCDAANFTLGGYAYEILSGNVKYDWQVMPGEEAQIWAYAVIMVTAKQKTWIQGSA